MNIPYILTLTVLGLSAVSLQAQSPINTVPEGITTYSIAATRAGQNLTSYFSAPLATDPVYTGAVATVTSNTIMVGDTPPPWTANQLSSSPYFVKMLSGLQTGRILQVTGNTTTTLTLDITDNSLQSVSLTATGFAVAAGDTFEVFPGDTLATLFGLNTAQSPLVLTAGTPATADSVGVYSPTAGRFLTYYFDSTLGYWKQIDVAGNANNAVVRPYAAFLITRRPSEPALSFVLTGRVAEVNRLIKVPGGNQVIYDSTGFAVDTPLSSLQLSNWLQAPTTSPTVNNADTVSVWNSSANRLDTYFQLSDSTWRKVGGGSTNESSFVISAGESVCFLKRAAVSGATSFLGSTLPYTLNASN